MNTIKTVLYANTPYIFAVAAGCRFISVRGFFYCHFLHKARFDRLTEKRGCWQLGRDLRQSARDKVAVHFGVLLFGGKWSVGIGRGEVCL